MQPTNDLLGKDPFDFLYGGVWSNVPGGAQERLIWN
jgi:hypothetical protein